MGNTIFDPDLYRRTQEESRYLLRNIVAPPGPPPTPKPKEEKPIPAPVNINIGAGIPGQETLAPEEWTPPTWFNPSLPLAGNVASMIQGIPPAELTPGREGFVAPPWMGPRPWGGRPIPQAWEDYTRGAIPSAIPTEGRFRIGEGPWREFPGEYWQTPPASAGLSVIPGSAGGRMITQTINGRQLTLPASAMAEVLAKEAERPYEIVRTPWGQMRVARTPAVQAPEFAIPPEIQRGMEGFLKVIQSPTAKMKQKRAAAQSLAELGRTAAEQSQFALDVYKQRLGIPLKEQEMAIRGREAETHRFAAENLAKYHEAIATGYKEAHPGTAIYDPRTGQVKTQVPYNPEHFSNILHWTVAGATETSPTGERFVNPISFLTLFNLSAQNSPGMRPMTLKQVPREWLTPYIERNIQRVDRKLKPGTKEYENEFNTYMKMLERIYG